jgi:hypothetical protein
MTIHAIETRYAGCRFRSRLEARWAVFFDTLKLRWEYEPQGYYIGSWCTKGCAIIGPDPDATGWEAMYGTGRFECGNAVEHRRMYLPDFRLTDLDLWVEVKGSKDAMDWELLGDAVDGFSTSHLPMDEEKFAAVGGYGSGGAAVLVLGEIPRLLSNAIPLHPMLVNQKGVNIAYTAFTPVGVMPLIPNEMDLGYYDATWGAGAGVEWLKGTPPEISGMVRRGGVIKPSVRRAYEAASSARFEHGEFGR